MTNSNDKSGELLGQERRRRWSPEPKLAMVRESLDQLPATPVQWLSDNGSAYTAEQTRLFARQIGLQPVTTEKWHGRELRKDDQA